MHAFAPDELPALFAEFAACRHVILAVSGGADSTALMLLAARWHQQHPGPSLTVVSIDHALRPESAAECATVAEAAARLALPCLVRRWDGDKPGARLQEKARAARYAILAETAAEIGADAIATAHTLEDQAETVLMRLLHGSSIDGLAAMRESSRRGDLVHLRPLLGVSKARLVATLEAAGIGWIEDPSNRNARFERVRLRRLLAELEPLGLDPARLALFARRAARGSDALEAIAAERFAAAFRKQDDAGRLDGVLYRASPPEIRLRLLEKAIESVVPDRGAGPYGLRLERLEALGLILDEAIEAGKVERRSLGGALVRLDAAGTIRVLPEPPRRRGR